MPSVRSRLSPPAVLLLAIAAATAACTAPATSLAPSSAPSAAPPSAAPAATPAPSETAATQSPPAAGDGGIAIAGFRFEPATLRVPVGTAVTWTNEEDALHAVTSGSPDADPAAAFDSGELDTGETFSVTFEEAGTFPFFCSRHPFMRGEVVVGG